MQFSPHHNNIRNFKIKLVIAIVRVTLEKKIKIEPTNSIQTPIFYFSLLNKRYDELRFRNGSMYFDHGAYNRMVSKCPVPRMCVSIDGLLAKNSSI